MQVQAICSENKKGNQKMQEPNIRNDYGTGPVSGADNNTRLRKVSPDQSIPAPDKRKLTSIAQGCVVSIREVLNNPDKLRNLELGQSADEPLYPDEQNDSRLFLGWLECVDAAVKEAYYLGRSHAHS